MALFMDYSPWNKAPFCLKIKFFFLFSHLASLKFKLSNFNPTFKAFKVNAESSPLDYPVPTAEA
jgi:hypothetical protein